MLSRLPVGNPHPPPNSNKPFLLLVFLSICAAILLIFEAVTLKRGRLQYKHVPIVIEPIDASTREDSYPGLVFSTDRLRFGPNGDSYWFCLTKSPRYNVTVRVEDPSKCTTTTRTLKITFTTSDWNRPRRVKAAFSSTQGLCPQGLVHACDSQDTDYDGLHVRLWIDSPFELTRSDEKTGEWVPEEILEAEEEGPQIALAPLERSRSAFNFLTSEYFCRKLPLQHDKLQCVLAKGTPYETPFFVVDPKNGVDEDGWNGFPVVLIVGGSHGNEAAGSAAAIHIARYFRPRRGRLVVIPYANIKGMKQGIRTIPNVVHRNEQDLNRNFPLNSPEAVQGDLASIIWGLMKKIRPDLLFDLHEGWGYYSKTKSNAHTRLVGSKSFSKGSSVICTDDAKLVARSILTHVNDDSIPPEKRFEMISPPVAGGLARKLNQEFKTRAILTETTKFDQSLQLRVSQHLKMVTAGLIAVKVLNGDYDESNFFNTRCVLLVNYGKDFEDSPCLEEKDGVVQFP